MDLKGDQTAYTSGGPSSSCISQWNYHVFLSFRGADTRNSFTGHLYDALSRSEIKTFMDDEQLPRGKEIKLELLKAIRGSMMSIIVFSENYASSSWCLDELLEILECKRTMGQLVVPVFYDVDPSVVRYQSGSYKKAFKHHASRFDKLRLEKWRVALTQVANISGHTLRNEENGNEYRFIQKIVAKVVLPEVKGADPSCEDKEIDINDDKSTPTGTQSSTDAANDLSQSKRSSQDVTWRILGESTKKAEVLALNTWQRLNTSPTIADAVVGSIKQRAHSYILNKLHLV